MSIRKRLEDLENHNGSLPPGKRILVFERDEQVERERAKIIAIYGPVAAKDLLVVDTGVRCKREKDISGIRKEELMMK